MRHFKPLLACEIIVIAVLCIGIYFLLSDFVGVGGGTYQKDLTVSIRSSGLIQQYKISEGSMVRISKVPVKQADEIVITHAYDFSVDGAEAGNSVRPQTTWECTDCNGHEVDINEDIAGLISNLASIREEITDVKVFIVDSDYFAAVNCRKSQGRITILYSYDLNCDELQLVYILRLRDIENVAFAS